MKQNNDSTIEKAFNEASRRTNDSANRKELEKNLVDVVTEKNMWAVKTGFLVKETHLDDWSVDPATGLGDSGHFMCKTATDVVNYMEKREGKNHPAVEKFKKEFPESPNGDGAFICRATKMLYEVQPKGN